MVLREQGVPIHIVYLGHRDGSTVIVPKSSTARSLRDLEGKTFARPSKYSNQYLVITKLMEDDGMQPGDLKFVDMAPPDMPSALAAGAIDAYFVGEPFAAKSEFAGTGRALYYAKDIWTHFISCVLVVRDELIAEYPETVRDLVRGRFWGWSRFTTGSARRWTGDPSVRAPRDSGLFVAPREGDGQRRRWTLRHMSPSTCT